MYISLVSKNIVLAALAILVAVLALNTITVQNRQVTVTVNPNDFVPSDASRYERLAEAIRHKTISFERAEDINHDELRRLHKHIEVSFPMVAKHLNRKVIGGASLLYEWKGRNPQLKPAMLCGHLDVVPVEPQDNWAVPPFDGIIRDGFIWGRGTLDIKNIAFGILESVEYLLSKDFQPERTIVLAFGHDEEISGFSGAQEIARHLRDQNFKAEFILDEGLNIVKGVVPGVPGPVALIGTEEKGFQTIRLQIKAIGGHGSMPPASTVVGRLSRAIKAIEDSPMSPSLSGSARDMFEYLAAEMPLPLRVVAANLWLFERLLARVMPMISPQAAALVRTTRAVTMISGGTKDNVLPSVANATINIRIAPHNTPDSVLADLRSIVTDPAITITEAQFLGPSPYTPPTSTGFKYIQRAVRSVHPDTPVAPALMIGNTDTRWYWALSDQIYRYNPVLLEKADIDRIHGVDERISLKNYDDCINFYYHLIKML